METAAETGQHGRGPATKRQVLVVDDEPQVLVAVEDMLADEYEVLTANSPVAALRLLEREKDVAVLLSDQRMPGMNGDELLTLSADLSDATRVLVTGYAELSAVIRAVNSGRIFAYVTKPWNGAELQMTVRKSVEHFELLRRLAHERQLLEDLMNNIPDAIYFKDRELRFQRANNVLATRVSLADANDVIGRRLSELGLDAEVAARAEQEEVGVLADGARAANFLRTLRRPDRLHYYSTTIAPVRTPGGEVQGLVGISRDITEKEEAERALRRLTQVRTMLSAVNAAIVRVKDRDPLLAEACRVAVEDGGFLGATILLLDRERGMVKSVVSRGGADVAATFVNAWTGVGGDNDWNQTTVVRSLKPTILNELRADDRGHWTADIARLGGESVGLFPLVSEERIVGVFALIATQPRFFDGEEVRLLSELADNVAFALDHLEKRELLDFLAYYDELTNLPKRDLLMDRLHQLMPARAARGERTALVLVDLSRFRHVNETFGRVGGDELLVQVSKRLAAGLAEGDTLARYDGNAFAFLLAAPGNEGAVLAWIKRAVLGVLSAPLEIRGTELRIAVRVGVAVAPGDAGEPEALVRAAEAALAGARTAGEQCVFYNPSLNARVGEKLTLETRLRRALDEEQFRLFYQPKVDLKTGRVVGLEALIRWVDPERGLVPPGQFIPLLEETHLILDVGRWVLDNAAAQYAAWLDQGRTPPRVAVNVSALQLAQKTFVRSVEEVLERHPAARGALDLELTESVLMDDLGGNIEKLRALKAYDVRIAIDDFGTGYSSLGYLSRLPIDALKIDRSFVIRMADDPQDMTIVTTIISLAHSLDTHVVAEGVETRDQARLLRLIRCDQIQGYLVGRPEPAEDVAARFAAAPNTWPPPPE
jgi:diguanylate cyclase (GGDEF)-like protein/PAS domain S-box-containing protein